MPYGEERGRMSRGYQGGRMRSRYEDEGYGGGRSRGGYQGGYAEEGRGQRMRGGYEGGYEEGRGRSRQGEHVPDYGQGGWFGDSQRHSEIGHIGGQRSGEIRHERAMRAHREMGDMDWEGSSRDRSGYEEEGGQRYRSRGRSPYEDEGRYRSGSRGGMSSRGYSGGQGGGRSRGGYEY